MRLNPMSSHSSAVQEVKTRQGENCDDGAAKFRVVYEKVRSWTPSTRRHQGITNVFQIIRNTGSLALVNGQIAAFPAVHQVARSSISKGYSTVFHANVSQFWTLSGHKC